MEKSGTDAPMKIEFFGKEYIFRRLDPSTVDIISGVSHTIASLSGSLEVEINKDFYERPCLIKFKPGMRLSPRSQIRFFLKFPLITKLYLKSSQKSIEIDRYGEFRRKAWYGEVHSGRLCQYIDAEFSFDLPFITQDGLVPLLIFNNGDTVRELTKIVIDPENLSLFKGENGLFTNEVYIDSISPDEFNMEYGTQTTTKAINPFLLIDRKMSVTRTVLTKFDRFGIARELGL